MTPAAKPPDPVRKRVINRSEFFSAIFILAVAALALVDAGKLPFGGLGAPDAGFIPMIEGLLLACAGMTLLAGALVSRSAASIDLPKGEGRQIVLRLAAALVAYVAVLSTAGFAISTGLFLWGAISFWRAYSVIFSALLALAMTSGLYVLFVTVLHMPLPRGILLPF
ncbi:MAG: tripartite tricarboxylate transporter TctB family protein [Candidatus Accumulibacter sp.]|jgi:hypothetical protein|nr:tripartite tricarboxylate transporter TctB family protein [Accumulibacter sp.]